MAEQPGPATRAMLEWVEKFKDEYGSTFQATFNAFLAEWAEPATPPEPEQPELSSPWRCNLCGKPVRIGHDLQPHHISYVGYAHAAELSDKDKQILIDNLHLTD